MEPEKKSGYWKFAGVYIALIVLGVGAFLLSVWFNLRAKQAVAPAPTQLKADEIVVTQLPNGDQLVENRTQGYKVTVPNDWKIDGTEKQFYDSAKNCKIAANIIEQGGLNVNNIKAEHEQEIKELGFSVLNKTYDNILVDGKSALKFTLDTAETGHSVSIGIPMPDKLYGYSMYSSIADSKICDDDLNIFLEKVDIR